MQRFADENGVTAAQVKNKIMNGRKAVANNKAALKAKLGIP